MTKEELDKIHYTCQLTGEDVKIQLVEYGFTDKEVEELLKIDEELVRDILKEVMSPHIEDWGYYFSDRLKDVLREIKTYNYEEGSKTDKLAKKITARFAKEKGEEA